MTGKKYNYLLLNYYEDKSDYISLHHDNEAGWKKDSGLLTLSVYQMKKGSRKMNF